MRVKAKLKIKHTDMIRRTRKVKTISGDSSYVGCSVVSEWLDFDTFRSWAECQVGHSEEDWHLDKDILLKGNKEYSPETCCFVPLRINILFTSRKSKRGDQPIGVYLSKYNKYIARCRDGENKVHLGSFDNQQSAFYAYKEFKENLIKKVAYEYKDQISDDVFSALLSYEVEITD